MSSQTDSGGPLVSLKDGVWWLKGANIWGQDCTEQNRPGVYCDVTFYLEWIFQQMRVNTIVSPSNILSHYLFISSLMLLFKCVFCEAKYILVSDECVTLVTHKIE